MWAPVYGFLLVAVIPPLYLLEFKIHKDDASQAAYSVLEVLAAYLLPLFTSIIAYRLFFHRLRHFPGPIGARISKLWHTWQVREAKNHLVLDKLYHEYGTFVRTGPSELTVFSPEALWAMNAPGNTYTRPDWYDSINPMKSLANVRSPAVHDQRRRIWDQAFSVKAIRNYEGRIAKYADQLSQLIGAKNGQPVNVYDFFSFYTSDVMSDLAFGKPFNNLLGEKLHKSVQGVRNFMGVFGTLSPIPWFVRLGSGLLMRLNGWKGFMEFTKTKMGERIQLEPTVPDVSSYLISASVEKGTLEEDREFLEGDALVLIIVGSDSMATTSIMTFMNLARYPQYQDQIRSELQSVASISDFAAIMDLPVLKSVIFETLRLWPPIPSGSGRIVPKGGLTVAGQHIPAGTTLFAPRFTIARLESCFARANEFIPERWTTKPWMVKDKHGYSPFSAGRYNCVGQRLAMMNVSHLVALLVSKYNIQFAPGDDGSRTIRDMRDNFTMNPGQLDLVFELREKN